MRRQCARLAVELLFVGLGGQLAYAATQHRQAHMRGTIHRSLDVEVDGFVPESTNRSRNATLRRQVVIAKYDEDISWLRTLPANFDVAVYQSKDPGSPHFVENVGNEASKYLAYIVEKYDNLPETVAFMQGGRADWHDPLPKDTMISAWDWGTASSHGGIAFLPTAAPCLIEDSDPDPQPLPRSDAETRQQLDRRKRLVPDEEACPDIVEHSPPQMETVRSVWAEVFEPELGPLPRHWFTKCCAQFEVTREAIRQHPLDFYERLLQWTKDRDQFLLQSDYAEDMRRNHDSARRDAGHVLEVLWALIFSDPMSRRIIS